MALDHEKKLAFVHKMTKMALEHVPHFDGGGVISAGNSNPLSGVAGAVTAQNSYTDQAPTSASTVGQQQATLAGQLGTEAAGGGPNPAQQQLIQNEQGIAQQQATNYAQNRSLNPGLAARMAGNTAAQTGQTAAGTAGIQQAQQQLAAQQEMGQLTGQEQTGALQAAGINAQVSQNNANAVNNTQGGILSSLPVVGSLFAKGGEVKKMAQGGSINVLGLGIPSFSNVNDLPDMSGGSGFSNPFASSGSGNFGAPQLTQPQLGSSAGLGGSPANLGGSQMASQLGAAPDLTAGAGGAATGMGGADALTAEIGQVAPLAAAGGPLMARGGSVPHRPTAPMGVSPHYPSAVFAKGGKAEHMPQSFVGKFLKAAMKCDGGLMKSGGSVKAAKPSEKAVVKDDSLKNDKVPAMLSQGEIVIPRHITQHPDAARKAAAFVQSVLNKKRMGKK